MKAYLCVFYLHIVAWQILSPRSSYSEFKHSCAELFEFTLLNIHILQWLESVIDVGCDVADKNYKIEIQKLDASINRTKQ